MNEQERHFTRVRIGRQLAGLRREGGMTQKEVAERAGIRQEHLSRIDAGRYAVTLETVQAIAAALGASVEVVQQKNH
jgi:transcriptional regulator with XRE-family HTH domain